MTEQDDTATRQSNTTEQHDRAADRVEQQDITTIEERSNFCESFARSPSLACCVFPIP